MGESRGKAAKAHGQAQVTTTNRCADLDEEPQWEWLDPLAHVKPHSNHCCVPRRAGAGPCACEGFLQFRCKQPS